MKKQPHPAQKPAALNFSVTVAGSMNAPPAMPMIPNPRFPAKDGKAHYPQEPLQFLKWFYRLSQRPNAGYFQPRDIVFPYPKPRASSAKI